MNCPICNSQNYRALFKKYGFQLVKCRVCSLVRIYNFSAVFDIKNYDYYKNKINLSQEELYNPITEKRFGNLLKKMEPYRENNTLLDIGCGEGHFLSVAKKMDWQGMGIEIAPHAAEICRKFNVDIQWGNFLEIELRRNYYDVITMFEVLEHLVRPKEFLFKSHDLLKQRGVLFITTPNFNSLNRLILQKNWRWIHPEHLFYFTPRLINRMLKEAKFKIIDFKVKHIDLPALINLYAKKSPQEVGNINMALREDIEKNRCLLFLKDIANSCLNLTGLGESIQVLSQKI